eukprot:Skav223687  [mRNA]  locus=scaffold1907:63520:66289:+ [translate_table: standard]
MLEESQSLRRSTRSERTGRRLVAERGRLRIFAYAQRLSFTSMLPGRNLKERYLLRHLLFLFILAAGAKMWLPGALAKLSAVLSAAGTPFRPGPSCPALGGEPSTAVPRDALGCSGMPWDALGCPGPLARLQWFRYYTGRHGWRPTGQTFAAGVFQSKLRSTARPASWMLENASPLWRFGVALLLCVRLPLVVLLAADSDRSLP